MLKLELATTDDGPAALGWVTTLLVPADCPPELVPALEAAMQS